MVEKTLCAGTIINLYKGADSKTYKELNDFFKVFVKGKKEEKDKQKKGHPEKQARVQAIWNPRNENSCSIKVYFLPELLLPN